MVGIKGRLIESVKLFGKRALHAVVRSQKMVRHNDNLVPFRDQVMAA